MEALIEMIGKFGFAVFIPIAAFGFVGILAQWSLYDKCGLPGLDCVIPVKNVITFLKIMGRPAKHALMVILPPPFILASFLVFENPLLQYGVAAVFFLPWAYFMIRVYIELCQCFGHYRMIDYALCVAFNGFYVLHLGLSYSEKYKGPVYGQENSKDASSVEGAQMTA